MSSWDRINKTQPVNLKNGNLPFMVKDYNFESLIARGGFSEVYLVTHIKFNLQYVAKVMVVDQLDSDPKWDLVDAEIKALSQLDHPHIIRLYDHFHLGNRFYLILEYCPGGCLHDHIDTKNGLSIHKFVEYGTQIVQALDYCHKRDIAHHDIKPGNILLDHYGRVKIADFGLSLQTSNGQLQKSFGGSYQYTSPEIFQKKPHDPKQADVWALGVVFAYMATGSSPWLCDSLGALKQLAISGSYKLNKPVPQIITDLISKMIIVEPEKRITMQELVSHPLFRINPRTRAPPKPPDKCNWEPIPRLPPISPVELAFIEDSCNLPRFSSIHTASSSIIHNSKTPPKISKRLHRHSNPNRPTFLLLEDFVEVN